MGQKIHQTDTSTSAYQRRQQEQERSRQYGLAALKKFNLSASALQGVTQSHDGGYVTLVVFIGKHEITREGGDDSGSDGDGRRG